MGAWLHHAFIFRPAAGAHIQKTAKGESNESEQKGAGNLYHASLSIRFFHLWTQNRKIA